MTTKRSPQRGAFGKPRDTPESIFKAVEKGGSIQLTTLASLLELIASKTDAHFHIAVEVLMPNSALLKTIDNERDALETICRLKTAPEKAKP